MFNWEDLRHFAAFARNGSVSKASRELDVDHVTVARRIAGLERALDLKLVDRRARAYVLTEDGHRIAAVAAEMLREAYAIARIGKAGATSLAGVVTISAPPAIAVHLIASRLDDLVRAHPAIGVHLVSDLKVVSLGAREADIAVRLTRPSVGDLAAQKVGTVAFGLYGTRDHLALPEPDRRFVGYEPGADISVQQGWLDGLRGTRPVVVRSNDILAQVEAVRAGVGLAVLPDYVARRRQGLHRVEAAPDMRREVWLAVHSDLRHAPVFRAVLDWLPTCFAEL